MTRLKAIAAFGVTGLVIFLIAGTWFLPGGLVLEITLLPDNTFVLSLPLVPDEHFTLHYYHSVENTPIWEVHSMDHSGALYIEEERYEKFGAGMGKMPGVGRMVQKGKYEAIVDMHQPVGDFVLRVGSPGVDHTLIWRGRQFNLSEKIPHRAVRFSGRPVTLLSRLGRYLGFARNHDPYMFLQPPSQRKENG